MKHERDIITIRQLENTPEWDGDIIYFILSPLTRKVKIGKSSNTAFSGRLKSLQIACPDSLVVLGIVKGGIEEERRIQGNFLEMYYRGEWYNYTKEIKRYINDNATIIVMR